MKRSKSLLFLGAVVGLAVSSCQPYNYTGGGIQLALENSKVILVDAPQVSCRSAHSATPIPDLAALSMDMGKMAIMWTVPASPRSPTLKLIYVSLRMRTSGLTGTDQPQIVAGQDLNCIVKNDPDAGSTLAQADGGIVNGVVPASPYTFQFEHRAGGFKTTDASKKTTFGGTASVLIYGLVHDPPNQDQPVIGRGSFQFNFGGILN